MPYNPEIRKRKSIRLKGYDYSQKGLYFITICCQNRESFFGEIAGAENLSPLHTPEMILNDAGQIANKYWLQIPDHFPNAVLHEHIVMPNHVHGIIELTADNIVGTENFPPLQKIDAFNVGVENFQPLQEKRNKFQKMIPRSVGSIVKGFKIGVTKYFRHTMPNDFPPDRPVWQRNYYEHIIRNEQSYTTISNYINNNPAKWQTDKFYTI